MAGGESKSGWALALPGGILLVGLLRVCDAAAPVARTAKYADDVVRVGDDVVRVGDDALRIGDDALRIGDDVNVREDALRLTTEVITDDLAADGWRGADALGEEDVRRLVEDPDTFLRGVPTSELGDVLRVRERIVIDRMQPQVRDFVTQVFSDARKAGDDELVRTVRELVLSDLGDNGRSARAVLAVTEDDVVLTVTTEDWTYVAHFDHQALVAGSVAGGVAACVATDPCAAPLSATVEFSDAGE